MPINTTTTTQGVETGPRVPTPGPPADEGPTQIRRVQSVYHTRLQSQTSKVFRRPVTLAPHRAFSLHTTHPKHSPRCWTELRPGLEDHTSTKRNFRRLHQHANICTWTDGQAHTRINEVRALHIKWKRIKFRSRRLILRANFARVLGTKSVFDYFF